MEGRTGTEGRERGISGGREKDVEESILELIPLG